MPNNSFWCQPEWVGIHCVTVTVMFGVVAGVQFAPEFGKVLHKTLKNVKNSKIF